MNRIRVFETHGVTFTGTCGDQAYGRCPFTGKAEKFYVNTNSMLWDSKTAGLSGNIPQFLHHISEQYSKQITPALLKKLSEDRHLPEAAFRGWHLGWDGSHYTIPVRDAGGTMTDIRLYRLGQKVIATAGAAVGLLGAEGLSKHPDWPIYICEGDWDTMALAWLLRRLKLPGVVVGVPGAGVFKQEWVPWFSGRRVHTLYDHDEYGENGELMAQKRLKGVAQVVTFTHWPDGLKTGFDVRDWIIHGAVEKNTPDKCWVALQELFRPHPRKTDLDRKSSNGDGNGADSGASQIPGAKPALKTAWVRPPTLDDVFKTFKKWLFLDSTDGISIMLGTVVSQVLDGPPVWLFMVGPPGCLAASTPITVRRGKRNSGRTYTIEELHTLYHGGLNGTRRWDSSIPTTVLSMEDGRIYYRPIQNVTYSGEKETWRVKVDGQPVFRATADHRIATPDGWKQLKDLTVGDPVLVRQEPTPKKNRPAHDRLHGQKNVEHFGNFAVTTAKLKWVRRHGVERTYDIAMPGPAHNFLVHGVVVHNCAKTETLSALSLVPSIYMTSSLTPHALISGANWKDNVDPSLIPRLNGKVMVIKDFTSILTMRDTEKDEIFGILRDAFDGRCGKVFGTGIERSYESRFTVLAAVTPSIYALSSQHTSLGERFLKFAIGDNLVHRSETDIISRAIDNIDFDTKMKSELADAVNAFLLRRLNLDSIKAHPPGIPDSIKERIVYLARFGARMRGTVSRDTYRNEIMTSRPSAEVGSRLGMQLAKLGKSLAAVGQRPMVSDEDYRLLKKVVIDTIPQRTEDLLRYLVKACPEPEDVVTAQDLSMATRYPIATVIRILQDLNVLDIVTRHGSTYKYSWGVSSYIRECIQKAQLYRTMAELERPMRLWARVRKGQSPRKPKPIMQ